jgi:putative hydrolase of the HAD superfamily
MAEHIEVMRDCAACMGISFDDCHRLWRASFPARIRGVYPTIAANFEWIAKQSGLPSGATHIDAATTYGRFTRASLRPLDGAIELLKWLRGRNIRVGLVTNCAPDIPEAWPDSTLAPYFTLTAFSSQVGHAKPDPEIYLAALDGLGLEPWQVLYVGDGSDSELSGAAGCGMRPVLVAADLTNTYDSQRSDVAAWSGDRIARLEELRSFL